jgi:GDP-L-fucose synthase
MSISIIGKKVLVTGSQSMLGLQVMAQLVNYGAIPYGVHHEETDLLDYSQCDNLFKKIKPNYIIHCAGFNGGIFYNETYPADIYKISSSIGMNVLDCAKINRVDKCVSVLTSCAYPVNELLEEKNFLNGEPHNSVQCHAYAKRNLFIYGKQLHKQYGLKHISVVFNNMYGPKDSFDSNKTKFIGGLIKKHVDARRRGNKKIEIWGTGSPLREVIYCKDAAIGLVEALIKYDDYSEVLNIGNGEEKTILEYANLIKRLTNCDATYDFNEEKPDGQMKKLLCNKKMRRYNISISFTPLDVGLRNTIEYYANI